MAIFNMSGGGSNNGYRCERCDITLTQNGSGSRLSDFTVTTDGLPSNVTEESYYYGGKTQYRNVFSIQTHLSQVYAFVIVALTPYKKGTSHTGKTWAYPYQYQESDGNAPEYYFDVGSNKTKYGKAPVALTNGVFEFRLSQYNTSYQYVFFLVGK